MIDNWSLCCSKKSCTSLHVYGDLRDCVPEAIAIFYRDEEELHARITLVLIGLESANTQPRLHIVLEEFEWELIFSDSKKVRTRRVSLYLLQSLRVD